MEAKKTNPEQTIKVLKYLNRGRTVTNSRLRELGVENPYSHIEKLILSGHKIKSTGIKTKSGADWEYQLIK